MSIDMNAWMGLTVEQEIVLVMFWVMPLLPNCLHLEGYAMLCTMNASMQRSYSKCARVLCMTWDKTFFFLVASWKRETYFKYVFETYHVNDCELSYNRLILSMS
jgi:hypothetical protein